jgi:hypothetical protein
MAAMHGMQPDVRPGHWIFRGTGQEFSADVVSEFAMQITRLKKGQPCALAYQPVESDRTCIHSPSEGKLLSTSIFNSFTE